MYQRVFWTRGILLVLDGRNHLDLGSPGWSCRGGQRVTYRSGTVP
jgi:hypothetical protein